MSSNYMQNKSIYNKNINNKISQWVRPSDWLPISLNPGDEKIVLLFPVYNYDSSYVAFTCNGGNYTVDWGDGSSTQNFGAGVNAQHKYNFSDISASTTTSEGFRQALITITPQSGQSITSLTLLQSHSALSPLNGYGSDILEVHSCISTITGYLNGTIGTVNVYMRLLKRIIFYDGSSNINISCTNTHFSLSILEIKNSSNIILVSGSQSFASCASLEEIRLGGGKVVAGGADALNSCFAGCYALRIAPYIDFGTATNTSNMFLNCYSLEEVPLYNTSGITYFSSMFQGCTSLKSVPLFDTTGATASGGLSAMFQGCTSLKTVPLFSTTNVTNMSAMFQGCTSLEEVPLFDTQNVTTMQNMFNGCYSLIGIPNFNTSKVTRVDNMFTSCQSINTIQLNLPLCTVFTSAFTGCSSLKKILITNSTGVTSITTYINSLNGLVELEGIVGANNMTNTSTNLSLYNLQKYDVRNMRTSFTLQNTKLSKDSMNFVFSTCLGVNPATTQTLTITSSLAANLNPVYSRSSTTTSGSTTISITDTSNFIVGTQVTGTGISDARSVTFTDTGDTVTLAGHGISNGKLVAFTTITTTTGISVYTPYYVINATTDTFQLSLTAGGSAIALTNNGSGTMIYQTLVTAIDPNVSVTIDIPAAASGTNTLAYRNLNTQIAVMKRWAITG